MKLYFLRHGPAVDRAAWPADDDFARPLTARGQAVVQRVADALADLQLELGLIITSPLTRAWQTAEIVARRLDILDRLLKDDRLMPGFDLNGLTAILRAHSAQSAIMLVGHEPDFSTTISALIGGGSLVCKKGGLARVDVSTDNPLRGDLVWLIPPSILTRPSGE